MKTNDAANQDTQNIFRNIVIILAFVGLMTSTIVYLNESEPDMHQEMMDNLAVQFSRSVINAHWQWQAEGRPRMIMLVHYDRTGKETGRRPVRMSAKGWPHVDATSDSCERVWLNVLDMYTRVDSFRVIGEYYDEGVSDTGELLQWCRYRLSTGPYFDYYVNSGRVISDD
ncbi:hypothetical protein [Alteromonas facilis]|uniref:hypothetical protein n=1 Tax=Alteromonas facilis TaxID=2048004 RepID=UPI000C282469|nr:hypothetical protein [Alteromonas facilis]